LSNRRHTPLADEPEDIPGPAVVPGRYHVALEAGGQIAEASFSVCRDPRLKVPPRAFEQQAAVLHRLYGAWSRLNEGVNGLRRMKAQLQAVSGRLGPDHAVLAERARALSAAMEAIEGELVDRHRESVRDVLRHRAGLNDTLADLISVVAIADEAPTRQARELSEEAIARVDALLARLAKLTGTEATTLATALVTAGVGVLGLP
jgi:hypothetical protein